MLAAKEYNTFIGFAYIVFHIDMVYIFFLNFRMLLASGCGDTNGSRARIEQTEWLEKAWEFGRKIYS